MSYPHSSQGPRSDDQPRLDRSERAQVGQPPHLPPRVPSGIAGLDTILRGGFIKGGIYLISGEPGTGKTILGNQIAFNHVASGGRALFVSILSETHSRMFSHLSSLSFFSTEPIGDSLYYISGYGTVEREGLEGLLGLLEGAIRDNRASLLVIDSAANAVTFAPSGVEFKEFLHRLQLSAEANGCTVLMLNSTEHGQTSPERLLGQTTVDGLIHLTSRLVGLRQVRELQARKLRGSRFLEGMHAVRISDDGVEVYPRLEALVAGRAKEAGVVKADRTRLAFGVERLDDMLRGGLLAGSSTLLLGPPGSGKTLLGLTFLAQGARNGEQGLYFGLNEPPDAVCDAGDEIGLDISSLVEGGRMGMLWEPALEGSLDVLAHDLLSTVRERGVKRLFIDGLDAMDDMNIYPERVPLFFTALKEELRALGITMVSAVELNALFGPAADIPIEGISARVENIVFLRYVEIQSELQRVISILKTRRTGHDVHIREFKITDEGIEVGNELEHAEAILTGVARTLRSATGQG